MPTRTVTVKSTGSPLSDMNREKCLNAINELSDTEIKNLLKLVQNANARSYLKNDLKFSLLNSFIK